MIFFWRRPHKPWFRLESFLFFFNLNLSFRLTFFPNYLLLHMNILPHCNLIPILVIIMRVILCNNFFLIKIDFPFLIIIIKIIIKLSSLIHIFRIIIIVLRNRFWFILILFMMMMMFLFLTFHIFLDLNFLINLFKNLFSSAFFLLTDLWA